MRIILDFPDGSEGKASAWNAPAGDPGAIPGSGRSPGEGNGNPLQCSCLENPRDGATWKAAEKCPELFLRLWGNSTQPRWRQSGSLAEPSQSHTLSAHPVNNDPAGFCTSSAHLEHCTCASRCTPRAMGRFCSADAPEKPLCRHWRLNMSAPQFLQLLQFSSSFPAGALPTLSSANSVNRETQMYSCVVE